MEKKYQVFISSTYSDLKEEREKAIDAILRLEHIPIGMELFNAGDDTQWAIIQRAIDNSDYYVLIVGFRYGSVTEDDIGYTEKEYDYAISQKIPVITFIKDRKTAVTEDERESKPKYQKKLDAFISRVQRKEVNYWKNADELSALISSSLVKQIKLTPRTGWVRADFDPIAISQEMIELSKENRELRKIVDNISNKHPHLEITFAEPDKAKTKDTLMYEYQLPEGSIHVRPLTIEYDLIDEVKELVTAADLQTYNEALPNKEEIAEYNHCILLYENAKKNAYCFQLKISNTGNEKANNIYMDLYFPNGLLAYYDYDIEEMEEPEKLVLPKNPVNRALDTLHKRTKPKNISVAQMLWGEYPESMKLTPALPSINPAILNPSYYNRDHTVNNNHDTTTLRIDSLIHSRIYTSDQIWFIATQRGTFTIDCKIMCEEYEEPVKHSFVIVIS